MTTSNDLLIKQRSVIEFLAAEGCSAANIHARMKTVYVSGKHRVDIYSTTLQVRISLNGIYMYDLID
ncbi:hypothetical protein PoB_005376500 [Plakobranchus ocellatus]|uniref:Uncharacterized protein n=1 Tax=Plakobranchus ocellatus TaxID=259542 RepID=A0AAV4C6D7_9GAST|nr:hypothetical protein PoB_005376500 [Plakobranchus ocellatus]